MSSQNQAASPATSNDAFAQLWDDVVAEAKKLETEVVAVAKNLETEAVADIRQVFSVGAPLAVQAIIAEAPKLISGTEKFGNAVASVTQQLEVKLGPVAVQDVQAVVQTAFRGAQQVANDAAAAAVGNQPAS